MTAHGGVTESGARRRPRAASASPQAVLELGLLGGFEVRALGSPLSGFESRKVRALLAYLALQGDRPAGRDELAALLWPDLDPEGARRNLRQALYNLRSVLGEAARCLGVDPQEIRLEPGAVTVDALQFESRVTDGLARRGAASIATLAAGLDLYRGELLAGFRAGDTEGFDEWLARERERLRELAVEAATEALRRSEAGGNYPTALRFARKLGDLEPLSEEGCRARMRLLSRLGRRALAAAQFEELESNLERELGVAPSEATRRIWDAIRSSADLPDAHGPSLQPGGPFLRRVGVEPAWRQLSTSWSRLRRGEKQFTLVAGARGAGKTRLIRSFLHEALEGTAGVVLQARASAHDGSACRDTLVEAVASLPLDIAERRSPGILRALVATVAAMPELTLLRADFPAGAEAAPTDPRTAFSELASALTRPLASVARGPATPVVLYVDDLESCPAALGGLLELFLALPPGAVWVFAAARMEALDGDARSRVERAGGGWIELPPLSESALLETAQSLVGEDDAPDLAAALARASRGLPVAFAEAVNLAADSGLIRSEAPGPWTLADREDLESTIPASFEELVDRRIELLPTTSRRLLGLAAVIGDRFHTDTLVAIDREHPAVLEAALGILVERWMVRPVLRTWTPRRRDRDAVLWAAGARLGPFEFAQRPVRERLYASMDPRRRSELHRAVAAALVASGDEAQLDEIAAHWRAGGEPGRAAECLRAAALWRRAIGDDEGAVARESRAEGLDPAG